MLLTSSKCLINKTKGRSDGAPVSSGLGPGSISMCGFPRSFRVRKAHPKERETVARDRVNNVANVRTG
jgi:hypothetical protein